MKNAETQLNTDYQYWSLELPLYFMGQIPQRNKKVVNTPQPPSEGGGDGRKIVC